MSGKEAYSFVIPKNSGPRDIFSNRPMIFTILTVACVAIASLLYGITIISKGSEEAATTERKQAMFLKNQNSLTNQAIPPIDLSVPAKIETATFALG